jgi:hypothetical protein
MSSGTRSVGVSRGAKVATGKKSITGASAAKGKKTPDYRSDYFSSLSDDSTQKATKGKHSIKDLNDARVWRQNRSHLPYNTRSN